MAQGMANETWVSKFILVGFSGLADLQLLLFVLFALLYAATLVGNALILTVVWADRRLHTPMYFFLGALSISETCYTFSILIPMLGGLVGASCTMSRTGCAVQMYVFIGLACNNCFLLAGMGYDRYLAICHPLQYPILMSRLVCARMVAMALLSGLLISLGQTLFIFSLPFCGPNTIHHFFCDLLPVIRLACTDTSLNEAVTFALSLLVIALPFGLIILSYLYILGTILRIPSVAGRCKAFSTCASHLTVVVLHFGCASAMYLRPAMDDDSEWDQLISVSYTVVTPLLNPMVYTLRNREVQMALRRVLGRNVGP